MIELERKRGYPFVIAYLFTKDGVKKLCGDLISIEDHTKKWDTCHGIVHYYNKSIFMLAKEYGDRGDLERLMQVRLSKTIKNNVVYRRWMLFGKNTLASAHDRAKGYFRLIYINPRAEYVMRYEREMISQLKLTRPKYVLYWSKSEREDMILGTWRKLPSTFLRQLA
jgi:hypothetical protein